MAATTHHRNHTDQPTSTPGTWVKPEDFTTPCPPWCGIDPHQPHHLHEADCGQLDGPGVIIEVSVRKNGNCRPVIVVDIETYDETGDTITHTACTAPLSVSAAEVFMVKGSGDVTFVPDELDTGGVTFESHRGHKATG